MDKITIILVDDHPIFRQGIRRVIERDTTMEVLLEVADGEEALRFASQLLPDVMLVDIKLPTIDGLELIKLLRESHPNIASIAITGYHDEEQLFHAIRAGAKAYFPKDITSLMLLNAIRVVSKGLFIVGDDVLDEREVNNWLIQQFDKVGYVDGLPNHKFNDLSPREIELLRHVAQGYNNQKIAQTLGISHQTVKNHLRRIQLKLNINDRTLAALYAVRRGWIERV